MIYILLIWLWPITGIIIAITFAMIRTKNDNSVIRFIAVCAAFLAGTVLGPFALSLFTEARNRDKASK